MLSFRAAPAQSADQLTSGAWRGQYPSSALGVR